MPDSLALGSESSLYSQSDNMSVGVIASTIESFYTARAARIYLNI